MRRRMNRPLTLPALIASLALASCASLLDREGQGTAGGLEISLGSATTDAVEQKTYWVLQRFGFILLKQELSPSRIYFETTWQIRDAFEDEAQAGAVSAETRLILRGGPLRGAATTKQASRKVWLVAENRIHTGQGVSISQTHSDEFKAYVQKIAAELKSEYFRDSIF